MPGAIIESSSIFARRLVLASLLAFCWAGAAGASSRVSVQPVFFVPTGEPAPSADQIQRLHRHLEQSQARYHEMLGQKITFAKVSGAPAVYRAQHDLAFYKKQPEGSAPQIVAELLQHFRVSRTACNAVYLVIVMNPHDDFPNGGGRPINGGYGTGGGVLTLSAYALDKVPNFQSTLQHELGHAFGLPHVKAYGYDMGKNQSIMSYNLAHHTNGFAPSKTPATLIPEDRQGFALNQRVFPGLKFEKSRDVPQGYHLHAPVKLGPMNLPTVASAQR